MSGFESNKRKAEDDAPDAPAIKKESSPNTSAAQVTSNGKSHVVIDDDPDWDDDKPICELMEV